MSTVISLFTPHTPLHKSQDYSKHTRSTPCPELTFDTKFTKRNLLKTVGLSLIGSGALVHPARAEPESPIAAVSSRISYSRFLEYLNEGVVRKVDLFENGSVAIAEIVNPVLDNKIQRVKVQLPGLQQALVRKLKEKEVDFAAHPLEINIAAAVFDLLANFAFPLMLLGALLLTSSSRNTPGGPNLPFGLGSEVICSCGFRTSIRTSWTERNPGRRFHCCARKVSGCGFVRWAEPSLPSRATETINGLLRSKNNQEATLKSLRNQVKKLRMCLILSWVVVFLYFMNM